MYRDRTDAAEAQRLNCRLSASDRLRDDCSLPTQGPGRSWSRAFVIADGFVPRKRSWRYSMLVGNGVIEKMFIEPEEERDPFEVSDADTMLKYINPKAVAPEPVVIFAKPGCPHCARAKALLESRGYRYDEISLGRHITSSTLRAVSGSGTWPQVFIGGKLIGSADDLEAYFSARKAA